MRPLDRLWRKPIRKQLRGKKKKVKPVKDTLGRQRRLEKQTEELHEKRMEN